MLAIGRAATRQDPVDPVGLYQPTGPLTPHLCHNIDIDDAYNWIFLHRGSCTRHTGTLPLPRRKHSRRLRSWMPTQMYSKWQLAKLDHRETSKRQRFAAKDNIRLVQNVLWRTEEQRSAFLRCRTLVRMWVIRSFLTVYALSDATYCSGSLLRTCHYLTKAKCS